ncbi:MAG: type II toxin-antitoxin system HicB family antitoxin [Acidobacteria bacterium]|nr:type II toxin-antitoxin system HicB family antitoxin [Acidobacteriota bacterium]
MLTRYIQQAMKKAAYKILKDGMYFGEIPGLRGVWASERTLDKCREVLQEVLEEWLVLKIRDRDPIPKIGRIDLNSRAA